jgi:hypothetical protein
LVNISLDSKKNNNHSFEIKRIILFLESPIRPGGLILLKPLKDLFFSREHLTYLLKHGNLKK